MRARWLVAAAVLLAAPLARASNGPMPTTVGTKGPVTLPVNGDAQTMFRMPSSIGWSPDHRIDLDLFLAFITSEMRNSLNDFESTTTTPGGTGGFLFAPGRPGDDELDDDGARTTPPSVLERFSFGLGLYVDLAGGNAASDDVRLTTFPETIPTRKGITFLTGALSCAFTPTDWLSLGVGLHAIQANLDIRTLVGGASTPLAGSPRINGVPFPGNPTYADFLRLFQSDGATDPTTYFRGELECLQFSAVLSASLQPHEKLGLGFAYRERSWAPRPFEGDVTINATRTFDRAIGGLDPTIQTLFRSTLPDQGQAGFVARYDAELTSIHVPRQARGSVAFWPLDSLVVAGEVAWVEWHRAFRGQQVILENGSNRDLNFVSGSSRIDSNLEGRWRNAWIFSAYAAWSPLELLVLRLGVSYGRSPLNPRTQEGYPSGGYVEWTISVGAGVRLGPVEVMTLFEVCPANTESTGAEAKALTAKFTDYTSSQMFVHLGLAWRF